MYFCIDPRFRGDTKPSVLQGLLINNCLSNYTYSRNQIVEKFGGAMLNKSDLLKKPFSARDLGSFGIEDIAYVKSVTIDGQRLHAIHAADGTPLTVVNERELAFATVRQHDMVPSSVH